MKNGTINSVCTAVTRRCPAIAPPSWSTAVNHSGVRSSIVSAIGTVAVIFAVARIAYLACYLADLATLRSLVWLVGFGSCLCLIVMGAQNAA